MMMYSPNILHIMMNLVVNFKGELPYINFMGLIFMENVYLTLEVELKSSH